MAIGEQPPPTVIDTSAKVIITGAAGLVGQNLTLLLEDAGYQNLVGLDKHTHNTRVLRELHPRMSVIEADLSQSGSWEHALEGGKALIMLQAQIGGENKQAFIANNVTATERVLAACHRHGINQVIQVSSSVLHSKAVDYYTETKRAQEKLVTESGIPHVILRPTLMFGWFDRKHLGWLSRFMQRAPVFPVPGSGTYKRQPLYIRDFCRIIQACLLRPSTGASFDISGLEQVDYIDIIRAIRSAIGSRTPIIRIPYGLFWLLLKTYALIDRNPPFTTRQLEALVIPEIFPVIPWPDLFGVVPTPFRDAIQETFGDPRFADVILEF